MGELEPRLLRFDPADWPDEDGLVDVDEAHARWDEARREWASRARSLADINALYGEGYEPPYVLDPRVGS